MLCSMNAASCHCLSVVFRLQVDRIRYILSSYLRERLKKVVMLHLVVHTLFLLL